MTMTSLATLSRPGATMQLRGQRRNKEQRRGEQRRSSPSPLTTATTRTTTPQRPLTSQRLPSSRRPRLASFLPPAASPSSPSSGGGGGGFPPRGDKDEKEGEEERGNLSSSFPAPAPLVPVLSRDAERTIGRTAMLGFACAVAGEVVSGGGGPLSQLRLLSSDRGGAGLLPSFALDALLAGAAASVFIFSLSPVSRTWHDAAIREALLRPPPPLSPPGPSPASSRRRARPSPEAKAAMLEVLAGRLALVGLLFCAVVERQTGGLGPLEQLGLLSRAVDGGSSLVPPSPPALSGARVLLLWVAFAAVAWVTRFSSSSGKDERR